MQTITTQLDNGSILTKTYGKLTHIQTFTDLREKTLMVLLHQLK
jgi:hypothetical protein